MSHKHSRKSRPVGEQFAAPVAHEDQLGPGCPVRPEADETIAADRETNQAAAETEAVSQETTVVDGRELVEGATYVDNGEVAAMHESLERIEAGTASVADYELLQTPVEMQDRLLGATEMSPGVDQFVVRPVFFAPPGTPWPDDYGPIVQIPLSQEPPTSNPVRHLDVFLTHEQALIQRRLRDVLHANHAKLANGRHVETTPQAYQWLLEFIGRAEEMVQQAAA